MKLYEVKTLEDGSVKVETILTPEETQFMLEFAMLNLMRMGLCPASVAKYAEEHEEEVQAEFLENVDKDKIGQA